MLSLKWYRAGDDRYLTVHEAIQLHDTYLHQDDSDDDQENPF